MGDRRVREGSEAAGRERTESKFFKTPSIQTRLTPLEGMKGGWEVPRYYVWFHNQHKPLTAARKRWTINCSIIRNNLCIRCVHVPSTYEPVEPSTPRHEQCQCAVINAKTLQKNDTIYHRCMAQQKIFARTACMVSTCVNTWFRSSEQNDPRKPCSSNGNYSPRSQGHPVVVTRCNSLSQVEEA